MAKRLNVGCGRAPSAGWLNYDNSPAVWLAKSQLLTRLLYRAGVIDAGSFEFATFCRANRILYANAKRIPHASGTIDVIYSSHMIEHLVRDDAWAFLVECRRALRPGGRLRLVVPDLHLLAHQYLERGDADNFLGHMQFETDRPAAGLLAKLKWLLLGGRGHHWMYDARSLGALMEEAGFVEVETMEPGQTRITEPGGLDLRERQVDSLYLEAVRPQALTQT